MSGHGLRPEVDSATHSGYRIEVVDGAGILAAASVAEVAVRHDGVFPPPVRRVDLAVSTAVDDGGAQVHVLTARVRIDRTWRPAPVLGRGPDRPAAGQPGGRRRPVGELRLVEVAGTAIDRARDRFGPGPPAPAQPTGSRRRGRNPSWRTGRPRCDRPCPSVPTARSCEPWFPAMTVTAAHLRAMFGLALTVVADAVAPDVLTVPPLRPGPRDAAAPAATPGAPPGSAWTRSAGCRASWRSSATSRCRFGTPT